MHCTVVLTTHRQLWRCNTIIVVGMSLPQWRASVFISSPGFSVIRWRIPDRRTQLQNAPISAQANGDWPRSNQWGTNNMLSILWTILIGFIAGVIAKFVTPGSMHEPQGFILTTALGIVGALVATYLGQALAGMRLVREPASSPRSWAQLSSCWCGDLSRVAARRCTALPDKSRLPLFRLSFLAPHDQKYGWEILDWAIRERQFCN